MQRSFPGGVGGVRGRGGESTIYHNVCIFLCLFVSLVFKSNLTACKRHVKRETSRLTAIRQK